MARGESSLEGLPRTGPTCGPGQASLDALGRRAPPPGRVAVEAGRPQHVPGALWEPSGILPSGAPHPSVPDTSQQPRRVPHGSHASTARVPLRKPTGRGQRGAGGSQGAQGCQDTSFWKEFQAAHPASFQGSPLCPQPSLPPAPCLSPHWEQMPFPKRGLSVAVASSSSERSQLSPAVPLATSSASFGGWSSSVFSEQYLLPRLSHPL